MPDLTNSYCERCGARYVFAPAAPKGLSLKGARLIAKGLKNFVLTDGQSMSDAMALARHDDEHQDSSRMTEAFHKTFNFCMTCRQYACDQCWNERTGACLSCTPESDADGALFDEIIAAREPASAAGVDNDVDWSTFAEGLAAGAAEPATQPEPFGAPIRLEDPKPAAAPAWPVSDLPDAVPDAPIGAAAKGPRRATRKAVDPVAASLWPLADEIAPEMTLTPEELELVESRLGQVEVLADAAPARDTEAEPEPEPEWLTAAPAPWLTVHGSQPKPPAVPAAPPRPAALPPARAPMPVPEVQPQRLISMPMAGLPPLAPPPAPPQAQGHTPVVGRLLGRHAPQAAESASEPPRGPSPRPVEPAAEPWPRATRWGERPAVTQRPIEDTDAPAPVVAAAQPAPPPAEAARPVEAVAPVRPVRAPSPVDARTAAAVRLSAVTATTSEPGPAAADAVDIESLWSADEATPGSSPDTVEARRRKSAPLQERGRDAAAAGASELVEQAEPAAEAPAPWPPLGASWPAQAAPGTPWPGPNAAPINAIVAAQQAEPTLEEMWAQSAQEVLNRGSVRVCQRCALPVSTQARFCRRCGTKQG
jgi:ribosomal protein L40E